MPGWAVGKGEVVVIVRAGTIVRVMAFVMNWAGVLASVSRTVKFDVPAEVGVPFRLPLGVSGVNPPGSEPDASVQV